MGGPALIFALLGTWLGVFRMFGLSDVVLRMWAGVAADPVLASIPDVHFHGRDPRAIGSAKDMLSATEVLLKRCPGALAVAVMVMGTILAAPIGVVGAAVITLSVIALPQMLAAGYDKRLAIGTIASAGTLGILIPPAIMLVVMAEMLQHIRRQPVPRRASCPGSCCPGCICLHYYRRDPEARGGAEAAARIRPADPQGVLAARCGAACSR